MQISVCLFLTVKCVSGFSLPLEVLARLFHTKACVSACWLSACYSAPVINVIWNVYNTLAVISYYIIGTGLSTSRWPRPSGVIYNMTVILHVPSFSYMFRNKLWITIWHLEWRFGTCHLWATHIIFNIEDIITKIVSDVPITIFIDTDVQHLTLEL